MLKFVGWLRRRKFFRQERGATLIEVVIAIVVLGLVVASVPVAIVAVHNFQAKQREVRMAENLARSDFEYIKSQPYIPGNSSLFSFPSPYEDQTVMQAEDYSRLGGTYFVNNYVYFVNGGETFPATPASIGNETGIQQIVIHVWKVRGNDTQTLYELINYKTNHEITG